MKAIYLVIIWVLLSCFTANGQIGYNIEVNANLMVRKVKVDQVEFLGQTRGGGLITTSQSISGVLEFEKFQYRLGIGRETTSGKFRYRAIRSNTEADLQGFFLTRTIDVKERSLIIPFAIRWCLYGTEVDNTPFFEPEFTLNVPVKRSLSGDIIERARHIKNIKEAKKTLQNNTLKPRITTTFYGGMKTSTKHFDLLIAFGLTLRTNNVFDSFGKLKHGLTLKFGLSYLI